MAAYTRKEKLMRGLMIYQRDKSPYWYARIKRPPCVGDVKVGGYRNVSLKTPDIDEAKRLAYAEYDRMRTSPSLSHNDFGWDNLFQRYTEDNKRNGINRKAITVHWNTYLRVFIKEKNIKAVEDFTATRFREFIDYRRDFWRNHEYNSDIQRRVALDPADSTMKEALVMTGTILTALYSYVDKPKPDFSIITRRFSSNVSRREHRSKKNRGFPLSYEHYDELRRRMQAWAHDDTVYNIHHRYARQRLYYAMILAYLTRARPGSELRNIRIRDMQLVDYGNINTYRIETKGKIGARTLYMEIASRGGTSGFNMFRLWVESLNVDFPNMGFDTSDAYLFAGSIRNKVNGTQKLGGTRFNQLFKAFLRMPGNEDIRFHPSEVTGRSDDNALEICFYDIRTTSISHYLDSRPDVNHIQMAYLCGVTVATMEYYYIYHNEMRNADKWLGFDKPGVDDAEKRVQSAAIRNEAVELIGKARAAEQLKRLEG